MNNLSRLLPFYRWHPEVAIRYLPVVSEIRKNKYQSVLEIGSGGLGITPYLGQKVIGLDTKFSPPVHPLLETKLGTGTKIPFPSRSFDVVISVDTLEHMAKPERKKSILEMLRVAKKEVIIAAPTGEKSLQQDKELAAKFEQIYGRPYVFLEEQIQNGLPKREEILEVLGENVRTVANEPLWLRKFLLLGWMSKSKLAKIFYWKILLLALPLFQLFNKPPYYRIIFFKHL